MPRLIKGVTVDYIPGNPGSPGSPAVIGSAGYWSTEYITTCGYTTEYVVYCGASDTLSFGSLGSSCVSIPRTAYKCTTSSTLVYHPAVASSPGTPYSPPTPAQISISLNEGWNSYANSIGTLNAGEFFKYAIKLGTTGAFLAVGPAGMGGQPLSAFTHGLMADISTVRVFEGGVAGTVLGTPSSDLRVARLESGQIVYAVGSTYYISTAPAYLPGEELYVYGLLYSGYDEVSAAEFVASEMVQESSARLEGVGSISARAEQFVEASIAGAGSMVAVPFPTASIAGSGAITAFAEQESEATASSVSTLWSYAEVTYPTTAYIAGVGSLIASPFPSATVAGVGSLTANTMLTAISSRSRLIGEAYQGQLTEAALTGVSALRATAELGGRGYAELPVFVGLGGDTAYVQGYGSLPMLASGATNGESAFVPEPINRGYGNLPFIVSTGLVNEISIGTGSADLPVFVGAAGDYDYGFGYGELPTLFGASYGGFIPDDMVVLISSALAEPRISQQLDLVMVLSSSGELVSTLSLTREQVLALLSVLQHSSSFSVLGAYAMSLLSGARGVSLEAVNVGNSADLYDTGAVWVVNLDTNASVQYDQYGFNSFFRRGNYYYGVANDGIYELSGDTDAGNPINALLDLGRTDLGYTHEKRVKNVHVGASAGGVLNVKVSADGQEYTYPAQTSGGAMRYRPVKVGWAVKGYYWNFTVTNPGGSDFDIESAVLTPIPLARRGYGN